MNLYLGVDGGQSSTTAMVGDQTGCVLGIGAGGPCNHVGAAEGRARFISAVSESLANACAAARLDPRQIRFRAACFGMSGGAEDKASILAETLPADRLSVTTDAVIALSGATAGEPGIITIAGTGSIAFGRNSAGRTARAGGWGYIFGDEGGGFDIVREALRAALRFEEGWGPPTALGAELIGAGGAHSANELLHLWYTDAWPRARVAQLARVVEATALNGDAVALQILRNAGQQLALLAGAVRRQLWDPGEPVLICYIGGVFRSSIVLEQFRLLLELEDNVSCRAPRYGPAAGALLEAYRADGLCPPLQDVPDFKT